MKWDACNPIGQGIPFLPARPALAPSGEEIRELAFLFR
jgi:hypothetical protein